MALRTVRMRHPQAGTYDAPESAVEYWKKRGWTVEADRPARVRPRKPEQSEQQEGSAS